MQELVTIIGLAIIVLMCLAWSKTQETWKEQDRKSDAAARDWWHDHNCPECGGRVVARSDGMTGYPYHAECTNCDAEFNPDHGEGEGPWRLWRQGKPIMGDSETPDSPTRKISP